jgi:hypothetical protein
LYGRKEYFMANKVANTVEKRVRKWLDCFVVDLNLCPFAAPVVQSNTLRITLSQSNQIDHMVTDFLLELDLLQSSSALDIATTLLVFPNALGDFNEYLDLVDIAEQLVTDSGLDGIVQLASFHPRYLFADEPSNGASHYSNRAPYPIIHLLREKMVADALSKFNQPEDIPERNIHTLESIGRTEIERRWQQLFSGDLG